MKAEPGEAARNGQADEGATAHLLCTYKESPRRVSVTRVILHVIGKSPCRDFPTSFPSAECFEIRKASTVAFRVSHTISAHATLTTTLLSACMEAGIVIVSVDARHPSNGVMAPFHSHHRQAGVAAAQLAVSELFRKRCWQRIVVAKIENQAAHLAARGLPAAEALVAMARLVGSGDPDNIEVRAARDYWRALPRGSW